MGNRDESGARDKDVSRYQDMSRESLVVRLKELLEKNEVQKIREEVEVIRVNFYKKLNTETERKKTRFLASGGKEEDFHPEEDPQEQVLKELLKEYRKKKAELNRKLDQERQDNLRKKYEVIEKIKALINTDESINKTFQEFRELQKEWYAIGMVPQQSLKDLWATYNLYVEQFYDYIKINKELRDLDFKKNLEAKTKLRERAEELQDEPDVLKAFKELQKLHNQWREIGPVPREFRSSMWERFKEATSDINKRHQKYWEDLKARQKQNLADKTALCEKAEEIRAREFRIPKHWEEASEKMKELQKQWRKIGFAPRKDNQKIYDRFKSACDKFFQAKREYYSRDKELQRENLKKKTRMCEEAEALKDSADWKETTDKLIRLQKDWKKIGPVPRKQSDQVWKRFRAACDHFFNRKSKHHANIGENYKQNLEEKEKLITEIETFKLSDDLKKNFEQINEFQKRWSEIGFVPRDKKDEIQERYTDAINKHLDNLDIADEEKEMLKFKTRVNNIIQKPRADLKLKREREKFINKLSQLKNDIALWENNMGFFADSKKAESMINEFEDKIARARKNVRILEHKIEVIDNLEIE